MRLPQAQLAIVNREKITDYLLNPAHPDNGGKARFFACCGFVSERWSELAESLKAMAIATEVTERVQSIHGTKYALDGPLVTPVGASAPVRTIWIIDHGSDIPRLVTAYPAKD